MFKSSVFGANTPAWVKSKSSPSRTFGPIPSFDFRMMRDSLRKREIPNQYFVDFFADANFGERLLDARPVILNDDLINPEAGTITNVINRPDSPRRSIARVENKVISVVRHDNARDFSVIDVSLRVRLNSNKFTSAYIEYSSQDISEMITVGNHMYDLLNDKSPARFHYFPKAIWGDSPTEHIYNTINTFLRSTCVPIYGPGYENFSRENVAITNGQLIYAMTVYRLERNEFKCTLNLRLMLLALSMLATGNHYNMISLMSHLYSWIVVGTCDSCLEKTLYFDLGFDNTLYDMLGHPADDYAAISISGFDVKFVTFECAQQRPFEIDVIPRLSHSGISVMSHSDKSFVTVWHPETNVKSECSMATCYCIVIKTLSELVVRACRGAFLGRDGIVFDWFREIYKRNGDIGLVDQYITKLILMYHFLPEMNNMIKNLFVILYYGIISDTFLRAVSDPTNFSDVAAAILNVEPVDKGGILQYCSQPNLPIIKVQEFLYMNKRHESIIELINENVH